MQLDRRDIGQEKRHKRARRRHIGSQHDLAGRVRRVVHRFGPDRISPLALSDRSDAHHRGRGTKRIYHLGQGDPVESQLRRIDEDTHLLVATTIECDLGHAVHAAKRLDNLRFKKIAQPFEIDRASRLGDKRQPCNRAVVRIGGSHLWRAGV